MEGEGRGSGVVVVMRERDNVLSLKSWLLGRAPTVLVGGGYRVGFNNLVVS